jgi:deoxyribose-phosphate aldolase
MTETEAAQMIDISAVQTQSSYADIVNAVEIAKRYRFINVHTLPCWTRTLSEMLGGEDDIRVGAPVGFPGGGHTTQIKIAEAKQLIEDGVEEMDIVMNVGKFKNKDYDYVLDELKKIRAITPDHILIKVIVELNCLKDSELKDVCDLICESGADFLKTGTGWVPGDANIARIAKIKGYVGERIKVKAAGGIRTRKEFDTLVSLGVERFGINTASALRIVESFKTLKAGNY